KKERVQQSGILEYFDVRNDLPPLGGLRSLKAWLHRFAAGFSDKARQMGLRPPRGILLVGIQGCGKSLAAKTIALEWKLPLVRLDPAQLFDKYVGESEKNLRQAFETAEAISPVVLWIDEIEKAFAGASSSESDAGLGRRLFGSFLTWMQEKKDALFSGAEIEQALVAGLYGILAENAEALTTERVLNELRNTVPLSRSRREYVEKFRQYAKGRFLPAR